MKGELPLVSGTRELIKGALLFSTDLIHTKLGLAGRLSAKPRGPTCAGHGGIPKIYSTMPIRKTKLEESVFLIGCHRWGLYGLPFFLTRGQALGAVFNQLVRSRAQLLVAE